MFGFSFRLTSLLVNRDGNAGLGIVVLFSLLLLVFKRVIADSSQPQLSS